MNINLHIERLILEDISLTASGRPLLQAAMQTELTRLMTEGGLSSDMQAGGAVYKVRTPGIQFASDTSPTLLGEQIAEAVYRGIGE
ncbi:hypothetical protein [Methylomonas sp. MgM2]